MATLSNIYLGNKKVIKPYLGNTQLNSVYLGNKMVWGIIPDTPDPSQLVQIDKISVYFEWHFRQSIPVLEIQQTAPLRISTSIVDASGYIGQTILDDNIYEINPNTNLNNLGNISQLVHTVNIDTFPDGPTVNKDTTLYIELNYMITSLTNTRFYISGYKAIQAGDNPSSDWTTTNLSQDILSQNAGSYQMISLYAHNTNNKAKIIPRDRNHSDELQVHIKVGN